MIWAYKRDDQKDLTTIGSAAINGEVGLNIGVTFSVGA